MCQTISVRVIGALVLPIAAFGFNFADVTLGAGLFVPGRNGF